MRRAARANRSRLPNHNRPRFHTAWTQSGHEGLLDHLVSESEEQGRYSFLVSRRQRARRRIDKMKLTAGKERHRLVAYVTAGGGFVVSRQALDVHAGYARWATQSGIVRLNPSGLSRRGPRCRSRRPGGARLFGPLGMVNYHFNKLGNFLSGQITRI
jgi:hypothetical protein